MKASDPPALWPGDRSVGALLARSTSHIAHAGSLAYEAARNGNTPGLESELKACASEAGATIASLLDTANTLRVQSRPLGEVVATATASLSAVELTARAAVRLGELAPLRLQPVIALAGVLRDACRALDGPNPMLEVRRLKGEARAFRGQSEPAVLDPMVAMRWRDAERAVSHGLRACQTVSLHIMVLRSS